MSDRGNVERFPRERARTPKIEPFRPFYAAQMEGRDPKPREWVIDGVLARRSVMLLAGVPKIGKSILLQQLLTATALGQPWLGRQTIQSRSFGMFCEDPQEEIERRQTDINLHHGVRAADYETEYSWMSRDGQDAILVEFERYSDKPKWTPLWDQTVDFIRDEGVRIVGFDTAATVFGGNENARNQTTAFLRFLQKLAVDIDGAVILNAHPSRSSPNSYSGNTAWLASVRAGLSLGRPLDYDEETREPAHVRVLRGLGMNYGGGITAERLEFDHGVLVPTDPEQRAAKKGPLGPIERQDLRYRLLTGLKRSILNGAMVIADVAKRGSMPDRAKRNSTDPQVNRVALNDLYLAQEEMLDAGQIVRVEVNKQVLIRPADGPYYKNEAPWLPIPRPELPNAAD